MAISTDKLVDGRIKHLEMLQAIIARMAGQGASLKNYCITLVTAICGLALSLKTPTLALLSFLPILVLWLLDAQYLRLERRFRALFDQVRTESWETQPTFKTAPRDTPPQGYWHSFGSWSLSSFYVAAALIALAVTAAILRLT